MPFIASRLYFVHGIGNILKQFTDIIRKSLSAHCHVRKTRLITQEEPSLQRARVSCQDFDGIKKQFCNFSNSRLVMDFPLLVFSFA
jgi:hypothetical protein